MIRWRILGVVHVLLGILLLPVALAFGLLLAPLVVLGPLWILVLGVLLWRAGGKMATVARRTHLVALGVALLLCVHGVLALRAAARSADEGGGLLGAYGVIPIAYGASIGLLSLTSLLLTRTRGESTW